MDVRQLIAASLNLPPSPLTPARPPESSPPSSSSRLPSPFSALLPPEKTQSAPLPPEKPVQETQEKTPSSAPLPPEKTSLPGQEVFEASPEKAPKGPVLKRPAAQRVLKRPASSVQSREDTVFIGPRCPTPAERLQAGNAADGIAADEGAGGTERAASSADRGGRPTKRVRSKKPAEAEAEPEVAKRGKAGQKLLRKSGDWEARGGLRIVCGAPIQRKPWPNNP